MPVEHQLGEVVKRLRASDVSYFECEGPDFFLSVHLSRAPLAAGPETGSPPASAGATPAAMVVRSAGMGVLRLAHPLGTQVALKEGDRVEPQQWVALLCVGDLLTPVFAAHAGVVDRVIGTEGSIIGYGDALFELRPG
ncbi:MULTISPECIES: hypothetical protein [unclassified Acidovorax]|uniref:hypothetical protein n=1 Tax=unclassified Acidovorax TaxID=2684926 RepID=UPI001C48DCA7|nr:MULTISPECIES: hypothetical protein [unclassified Acidovorax]MBV7429379.1 hypothetical protein [Acidovorax sp. sif0732]MBV7451205.1 hypothetical protein [Acidovorax sp. sif0715]